LAFFGHSLGCIVARAAALELERRGIVLAYAALSAMPVLETSARSQPASRLSREQLLEFMRSINMNTDSLVADSERSRRFLEQFAAQLSWSSEFVLTSELSCPVGLFYADRDIMSTPANIETWKRTGRKVDIYRFSGDHNYLHTQYERILERVLARMPGAPRWGLEVSLPDAVAAASSEV
jgi:surfactin synthase thioesterase subunit